MKDKIQDLKPESFIDENYDLQNVQSLEGAFDDVVNKVNNYLEALKDSTLQKDEPFKSARCEAILLCSAFFGLIIYCNTSTVLSPLL